MSRDDGDLDVPVVIAASVAATSGYSGRSARIGIEPYERLGQRRVETDVADPRHVRRPMPTPTEVSAVAHARRRRAAAGRHRRGGGASHRPQSAVIALHSVASDVVEPKSTGSAVEDE